MFIYRCLTNPLSNLRRGDKPLNNLLGYNQFLRCLQILSMIHEDSFHSDYRLFLSYQVSWPVKFLKLKFINFKIYRFLYVFSNIFIEKFEIQYPVVFSYSNSKFYIYVKNVLKIVLLLGS